MLVAIGAQRVNDSPDLTAANISNTKCNHNIPL